MNLPQVGLPRRVIGDRIGAPPSRQDHVATEAQPGRVGRRMWRGPLSGVSLRWRLTLAYSLMLFTMLSSFSLGIYWYVGNRRMDELVRESEARAEQFSADLRQYQQNMAVFQDMAAGFSVGPIISAMLLESRLIEDVFNPFLAPGAGLRVFDRKHNLVFPPEAEVADNSPGIAALPNRAQVLRTVPNRLAMVMALRGHRHREVVTAAEGDQVLVYTVPLYQQNVGVAHPHVPGLTTDVVGAMQILTSLKPYNDTLAALRKILIFGTVAATALAALTGAALAQTAIAPIHRIANTAETINRAQDLGRRIAVDCPRDEIGHLAVTVNDMLDRIEGMFDRQRTFLADVSHELRTPLTTIRGEVELMQRTGHVDADVLAAVLGESERMSRMIDDLLLLARADTATAATGELAPMELDQLVMDVFQQAQRLARSNGEHKVALGDVDPVTVLGDADRLKQLLLNLVANGLKHTPPDTTVTIALQREADVARLLISDDGPGIPETDVPHVFDRFYRVDKARSRASGGTGLGLAIVRSIARAHGGDVALACPANGGTTFTVTIPLPDVRHGA